MIEVAYQVLTNNDGAMPFVDLWKDVSQEMGFSQTQFEDNIAQFYTDLSLDGRFLNMSQNTWDLRSRHTYSESVMDTDSIAIDEDDEEEESEIVEDGLDEVGKRNGRRSKTNKTHPFHNKIHIELLELKLERRRNARKSASCRLFF